MNANTFTIHSSEEMEQLGEQMAQYALSHTKENEHACIFALTGDLGSGKTTFSQGFAKALQIQEKVLSPTFVIMKLYELPSTEAKARLLYHIDCYRLKDPDELEELGWEEIKQDKTAIILIEWAERVKSLLPSSAVWLQFETPKPEQRTVAITGMS